MVLKQIGVVISNKNLVDMVNGQPIIVNGVAIGLPDNIVLFIDYGEEEEYRKRAIRLGLLSPDTKVIFNGKETQ